MTIPFIERRGSSVNMATARQLLMKAANGVSRMLAHDKAQ
jgi:hypothetical protein